MTIIAGKKSLISDLISPDRLTDFKNTEISGKLLDWLVQMVLFLQMQWWDLSPQCRDITSPRVCVCPLALMVDYNVEIY